MMQTNKMTKGFLYFICAVSAMGGLLFGYDWVVIGGAKPFYELYFDISNSPVMQGVAMTTALIGCLVGAMVAGAAADKYGRKPLLMFSAVLFTVSAIATGLFNDFTLFNIARFIGGVGIGVASALAPMYIAEVSPAEIRGRMVSLNQMTIVLGILAAQLVNMLLAKDTTVAENQAWNIEWGWRWMFWAETLPAALFLVMSFFIPESPVFIKLRTERLTANHVITPLTSQFSVLSSKKYHKVLLLGLVIAVFQQWCGTNVIFNYAQEIFVGAGFDVDGMFINIVITGIANVIFTIVALYTIEKWGRRTLMLIGAGGLGLIFSRNKRFTDGGPGGDSHFCLCDDVRTCHLDTSCRDFSASDKRCCDGYLYLCPLGGMLYADILVSLDECGLGKQWNLLDLQRNLLLCLRLPFPPLS